MLHVEVISGGRGDATIYYRYITRHWQRVRGLPYTDLKGCFYGNLPRWANGDPGRFFYMADLHERVNGSTFRALEIMLPLELTLDQNIEMALTLVPKLVGGRPWCMVVHNAINKETGKPNPHMHLMYSDRACDGIPRPPEQYFSRANPLDPASGGVRKLSGGKLPSEMGADFRETRRVIAEHMNEVLAAWGHKPRMDHRSYLDQQGEYDPVPYLDATVNFSLKNFARCFTAF